MCYPDRIPASRSSICAKIRAGVLRPIVLSIHIKESQTEKRWWKRQFGILLGKSWESWERWHLNDKEVPENVFLEVVKSGSHLWGLQGHRPGLTSRLNLDLNLNLLRNSWPPPRLQGGTILNASKLKSYCFFMRLYPHSSSASDAGLWAECVCEMACASHHHGNARCLANYLLQLAHRDTVNDT